MEYEIGETIELIHNKKTIKLKIEEDSSLSCEKCFFNSKKYNKCVRHLYMSMNEAYCSSTIRHDHKSVIYKKIK